MLWLALIPLWMELDISLLRAAGPIRLTLCETVTVRAGEPISDAPLNTSFPDYQITQLGQGNTGVVYRLRNRDRIRHLKVFKTFKRGWDKEMGQWTLIISAEQLAKESLQFHQALLNKFGNRCADSFYFPKVTPLDPITLEYEPTLGSSVFHLLIDPRIPTETKLRVYDQYQIQIEALAKQLGVVTTIPSTSPDFSKPLTLTDLPYIDENWHYRTEAESSSFRLHIVADGVILNREQQFVLVDGI